MLDGFRPPPFAAESSSPYGAPALCHFISLWIAHERLDYAARNDIKTIINGRGMLIEKLSIRQVKAARELLAWSQETLAYKSGVSLPTIQCLEAKDDALGGREETRAKIIAALERAGVVFLDADGEGPGVRLRKAKGKRK